MIDNNPWEAIARAYDEYIREGQGSLVRKFVIDPHIDQVLSQLEGSFGIDHGSGGGHGTYYLAKRFGVGVGFDATSSFLSLAQEQYPGLRFYKHDGRVLPSVADIITSKFVLPFVPSLQEEFIWMNKNLRPGGHVVATVFHPERYHRDAITFFDTDEPVDIRVGGRFPVKLYPRTLDAYVFAAQRSGFSLVDVAECTPVIDSPELAAYEDPVFVVCTFQKMNFPATAIALLDADLSHVYFFRRSNDMPYHPGAWSLASSRSQNLSLVHDRIYKQTGMHFSIGDSCGSQAGLQKSIVQGVSHMTHVNLSLHFGVASSDDVALLPSRYVGYEKVPLDHVERFCYDNLSGGFCTGLLSLAMKDSLI